MREGGREGGEDGEREGGEREGATFNNQLDILNLHQQVPY